MYFFNPYSLLASVLRAAKSIPGGADKDLSGVITTKTLYDSTSLEMGNALLYGECQDTGIEYDAAEE